MKKQIKSVYMIFFICTVLFFAGCYNKPHTQKEVEEYVAQNVPEASRLIDHYEQKNRNGTEYVYVFQSQSRDLKFYAYSTIGGSSLTGYNLSVYYDMGRRDYYLEKMRSVLSGCMNSEMCLKPDLTTVSTKLYLSGESDAKELSSCLAKCNGIVKEEYNYQPGADLARKDVLGIYFAIYPSAGAKDSLGFYYLNGEDDEKAVYQELMKLLK